MLIVIMTGVLTGFIWTFVGVVFKYLASAKLDAQKYFLLNYFFIALLGFVILGIGYFIFPIVNAIRASNGEAPYYPMTINFV